MTINDLELLAHKGAKLPAGLNGAEQIFFLGLRRLYAYANRYRTQRTLENADAFVKAVYGVGRKKRITQDCIMF